MKKNALLIKQLTGQIIIFPWNKGISLTKPPFGVRSCEVAIIWPELKKCFLFMFQKVANFSYNNKTCLFFVSKIHGGVENK